MQNKENEVKIHKLGRKKGSTAKNLKYSVYQWNFLTNDWMHLGYFHTLCEITKKLKLSYVPVYHLYKKNNTTYKNIFKIDEMD